MSTACSTVPAAVLAREVSTACSSMWYLAGGRQGQTGALAGAQTRADRAAGRRTIGRQVLHHPGALQGRRAQVNRGVSGSWSGWRGGMTALFASTLAPPTHHHTTTHTF